VIVVIVVIVVVVVVTVLQAVVVAILQVVPHTAILPYTVIPTLTLVVPTILVLLWVYMKYSLLLDGAHLCLVKAAAAGVVLRQVLTCTFLSRVDVARMR